MASLTSLPTEIVVQILSSTDAKEPWLLYQLGHVCGGWRAIVKNSPQFWANVVANTWYFPTFSQHDVLALYCDAIRRSAPYSLAVFVDLSLNGVVSRRGGRDRGACFSPDFVATLLPYGQRLSSVALVLDSNTAVGLRRLLHGGLPNLEELALIRIGSDTTIDRCQMYACPDPAALPRLHTLRVSGVLLGRWLAGPSLAHLHVLGTPQDDGSRVPSWGVFLEVLERCPLKTLEVCDALPMIVWPQETEMLLRWPDRGALQALNSCILQDEAPAISSFSMFLCTAPLPPGTLVDVTLTSSRTKKSLSDNLFSLAFRRNYPELARRVELDTSLRVYAGDRKLTDIRFSLTGVTPPEPLAQTLFSVMPSQYHVDDLQPPESLCAGPDFAELVLTLEMNEPIQSESWSALFTLLPYLHRLELRFPASPALVDPGQQAALSHQQSQTTTSLLAHLSSRIADDGPCPLLLLQGLHIHGLRLGEQDARDLSREIVCALAARANDHGSALKHLTLQCVGTPPPSLKLLPALVGDVPSCVVLC